MFFDILWLLIGTIWFLYHYYYRISNMTIDSSTIGTEILNSQVNKTTLTPEEEEEKEEDTTNDVLTLPFNQFQRIYLGKTDLSSLCFYTLNSTQLSLCFIHRNFNIQLVSDPCHRRHCLVYVRCSWTLLGQDEEVPAVDGSSSRWS